MKKKRFRWWFIIHWFLAFSFLCSIPECFDSSFAAGIICVLFAAVFLYLGIRSFRSRKDYSAKERDKRLGQIQQKAEIERRKQAEEERHNAYVAGRQAAFAEDIDSIPRVDIEVSAKKATRQRVSDLGEIKFTNITQRTVIDNLFPLIVIDTETTGLTPSRDDIIEISAIRLEKGFQPISCFTTLLKPRGEIPEKASRVNNITDEMVADKPSFSQIADSFSDYISGCNILGHNLGFDLKFIYAWGATIPNKKFYDTLSLARLTLTSSNRDVWNNEEKEYQSPDEYDVEDYKLTTLCDYYGIYRSDAHRSLSDCYATALLFENLINDKLNKT